MTGKKEDNGYKYIDEVGVSIQGQDANNAWKTTYNVIQALKMPVEVIFAWQDNPKAATPGAIGKFAHMAEWTNRDIFYKALGEFLTEGSQLENVMFGIILFRMPGEFYAVLNEYVKKTFGPKIEWFEEVCQNAVFTDDQRARLDESCVLLRELLPKRNLVIHGETHEIGRGEEEPQMYRGLESKRATVTT